MHLPNEAMIQGWKAQDKKTEHSLLCRISWTQSWADRRYQCFERSWQSCAGICEMLIEKKAKLLWTKSQLQN
jgi:hypothetical protein